MEKKYEADFLQGLLNDIEVKKPETEDKNEQPSEENKYMSIQNNEDYMKLINMFNKISKKNEI